MAVAAILFSLWFAEISKALEIVPKKHSVDNVASRGIVSTVLFSKALPVAIMSFSVAAIFLPDALRLAKEALKTVNKVGFDSLERYDAVRTAYCFVTFLSVVLALYMSALVWKLWVLRKQLGL